MRSASVLGPRRPPIVSHCLSLSPIVPAVPLNVKRPHLLTRTHELYIGQLTRYNQEGIPICRDPSPGREEGLGEGERSRGSAAIGAQSGYRGVSHSTLMTTQELCKSEVLRV